MKKLLSLSLSLSMLILQSALCLSFLSTFGQGQTTTASGQTTKTEPANQTPTAPLAFGLEDGTPVKLRLSRTMSSADAKTGETIDFEVLEDVKIGDLVVIPRGGVALGTVTQAKPKGRMGKAGKLDMTIDSVRLVSGEKVALRAVKESKGSSSTGAMTGAMVATGILFFPAAPLFLFMKGKDITVAKGTAITAYVNGAVPLDPKNFAPPQSTQTSPGLPDANVTTSSVQIKSNPDGAEISVDGKFVGSTPSTITLTFGDHAISIKKSGYVTWERTITISSGGNINIDATLEKP